MAKKRKTQQETLGREWFDREYSAREVYGRLWGFARRYRRVIFLGAFLGMVTGGAWVPIFSAIQPMLQQLQPDAPVEGVYADLQNTLGDLSTATGAIETSGKAMVSQPEAVREEAPKVLAQVGELNAVHQDLAKITEGFAPKAQKSKLERQSAAESAKYQKYLDLAESWLAKVGVHGLAATMCLFGLLLVAVILLKMITQFLNQYYLTKAGMQVVRDVRNAMFAHLQAQSLAFHGRSDVGKLMSRASNDPETLRTLISQTMSDICRAPFELLGAIGFVCWFAIHNDMVSLLLIAVIGYPMCIVPVVWLGRMIRKWSKRLLEQTAGIGSNFHENLTCIRVVKAYHTEQAEIEKYEAANLRALKMSLRAVRWGISVGPMTEAVAFLLAAIFIIYCFGTGHGVDEIIPLVPPFLILYKPMKQLGRLQTALESGRAALQRIFSLLDVHEELLEKPDALPLAQFTNAIEFDHVDFRYASDGVNIIKDAHFTIRRGQMYAVVGSTGSGKSTLANLLARFYDISAGQVSIDGHDIRDYRIADVRNIIGAVTQESLLFNTTIAANIAYGSPNATQAEIEHAAKLANAHDFIVAHPEGYNRIVGEKGFVLSGGERQRVAIARAILRNPPILILDEATSALDTITEQQVQHAINNLMQNRTIFAIAHRLSTIRKADCILVLDHGVIVERGTHDELYAKGGVYRRLCDIQNRQHLEA